VNYVAPLGSGLKVQFGKFVTYHGAEVIEARIISIIPAPSSLTMRSRLPHRFSVDTHFLPPLPQPYAVNGGMS